MRSFAKSVQEINGKSEEIKDSGDHTLNGHIRRKFATILFSVTKSVFINLY